MCAVYAFMRECDDRSDGPEAALERVLEWRQRPRGRAGAGRARLSRVCRRSSTRRGATGFPRRTSRRCWTAWRAISNRARSARSTTSTATATRVASVVGLTIIHIFGFEEPRALETGREMRHRVSVDQYSCATCARTPRPGACNLPAEEPGAVRRAGGGSEPTASDRAAARSAGVELGRARGVLQRVAAAAEAGFTATRATRCGR